MTVKTLTLLQEQTARRMATWGQKLSGWGSRYEQYCLLGTVTLLWCFIFQEYFVFDRLFLFEGIAKDTFSQFYPIEYFRISRLKELDLPLWSFQFGLGANVYMTMIHTSPFDLLYLFFNNYDYVEAIPAVFFLKFACAALFFHAFLKKIGLSSSVSCVGAILYSFSGYMILNAHWYHYLDYAIFSALFLYFFERWYQDGFWFPLVILLGFVSLKKEIQLVQLAFFGFFYIVFRCSHTLQVKSDIVKVYFRLALLFCAGLLLWAYYLLPDLSTYLSSSRVQGASGQGSLFGCLRDFLTSFDFDLFFTTILRTLSPDMLHAWIGYGGPKNYFEASTCSVGIFSFCVFLCAFFIHRREYRLLWIFPLVFFIVISFSQVIFALNIFMSGSLKYISLYLGFYILFTALVVIDAMRNEHDVRILFRWFLVICIGVLGFLWVLMQHSEYFSGKIDKNILSYAIVFLLIYIILLYGWRWSVFCKYLLFVIVVVEAVFFARITVHSLPGALSPFFYDRGERYFDHAGRAGIQELLVSDNGFFRIEKGYRDVYLNDAMVQQFFGTESYISFSSSGLTDFYKYFDLSLNSPNITSYRYDLEKRNELQNLLIVKYFLCKTDEQCSGLQGFSLIKTTGDLRIYRNDALHPFGKVLYQQIAALDFQALTLEEKRALVPHTAVTASLLPAIPIYGQGNRQTADRADGDDAFLLQHWDQQQFSGTLTLERPGILFFPVPFDPGWQVEVNGRQEKLVPIDFAFSGVVLERPGRYAVALRYIPPFMWPGLGLSLLTLLVLVVVRVRYPRFPAY